MRKYSTAIIGFGKAGKTLAAKLAKHQERVVLIEREEAMYGGTCINVGCIPSKFLIEKAKMSPNGSFEIKNQYYQRVIEAKNQLIKKLRAANLQKLLAAGVDVLLGVASFEDEHHICIQHELTEEVIEADRIIINTGSHSVVPAIEGIQNNPYVYFSDSLMAKEALPQKLIIIGAGYIGLEFASMYADFGSDVVVLNDKHHFLPKEDEDIAQLLKERLEEKGVRFVMDAEIQKLQDNVLFVIHEGKQEEYQADTFLFATGRKANTEDLRLQKVGIHTDDRGSIVTNEHLRTNIEHIWAAGDVRGKEQFTYISLDDSRIIYGDMITGGHRDSNNRGSFAYSLFIDPPFARVGLNEKEARGMSISYQVVKLKVEQIPKAKILGKTSGILKAIVEEGSHRILVATLFCEEAHELINFLKLAIDQQLTAEDIQNFMFSHPSMSEALNDLFSL